MWHNASSFSSTITSQCFIKYVVCILPYSTQLFEDIQERERNMASLESYATQLSERILHHALPLLPVLDPFQDSGDWDGMEPDTSSSLTEPMMS